MNIDSLKHRYQAGRKSQGAGSARVVRKARVLCRPVLIQTRRITEGRGISLSRKLHFLRIPHTDLGQMFVTLTVLLKHK